MAFNADAMGRSIKIGFNDRTTQAPTENVDVSIPVEFASDGPWRRMPFLGSQAHPDRYSHRIIGALLE